ncbi:DUF3850 domain-containing protein [Candidatus Kaiserbacteria bacterium]|nr:DUF3850 domain-containing protein [Candidatus Kaiserbacteria bacterium]MCB9811335.1 DUF3850 domain-containing protein [Candidatus Nomurabacteria bacterium]
MSRRIVKKILPEYFEEIVSGKKKFEFRVADFEVEEGDVLVLEEWTTSDPETREKTGRVLKKQVGYVRKFNPDEFKQQQDLLEHGFYIIQIE